MKTPLTTLSPRFTRRALLAATSLLLLGGLVYSLSSTAADTPPAAAPAKAALTVSTTRPVQADWPVMLTASGSIAAWQEAIVGTEIGGLRLAEVLVNVGDRVSKGQLLARLQSETVEAELAQTRAALAEAEASLAEARANAARARLVEGSGALSAQQIAQYLTAETTAQARLESAKARLTSEQLRLAQTRIVAPDDGTISARSATLGAVVQPGMELYRLIRRDRLEWRAELTAADLAQIKPGMAVSLSTTGPRKLAGKVRMLAPTLDPQTRNGIAYVDVIDRGDARPGMFARGEVELARSGALTLPQSAVLLRDGFSYVFRVGPDQRLARTKVSVGRRSGEMIAITSGLDASTTVVKDGVGFLSDGDLVRVVGAASAK
jgi:RND family efflux transporter MFP subunit